MRAEYGLISLENISTTLSVILGGGTNKNSITLVINQWQINMVVIMCC